MLLTTTLAITSLLALHATAVPQAPSAKDAPRTPDKCGPAVQGKGDPADTCTAKPATVANASAFGVVGSAKDPKAPGVSWALQYDWSSCDPTVMQICKRMAAKNTTAGQWYFETGPADHPKKGDQACQMGFWLPRDNIGGVKSDPKAAQAPTELQCQTIYNTTLGAAAATAPKWYGASVNLKVNPAGQQGQYSLPGGSGTGEAANGLYPSYVIAAGKGGELACYDTDNSLCPCAADSSGCEGPPTAISDPSAGNPPSSDAGSVPVQVPNNFPMYCSSDGVACSCAADGVTCV